MKKIFSLLLILLLIVASTVFWGYQQINQFIQQPISAKPDQLLKVERGTTGKKLAALFESEKLVSDAKWLPLALKIRSDLNNVKAGTYILNNIKDVEGLLRLLNSGKEAQFAIRFVEGENWTQIQKKLEKAPHLKREFEYQKNLNQQIFTLFHQTNFLPELSKSMMEWKNIEGWIYPNTYHYTPNSTDKELLKRTIQPMVDSLEKAWSQRDADLPLNNPYEMLILASIVEKESAMASERARIASVFINRLKLKMKLQTDPTVIYGMGENYKGNIRKKDLETATPYNTYVINGLPPTPIASPSESSLMAVSHPDKTDFLYFVADGSGGHKFSRNLVEHNKAVQEYLRWYRENKKK